MVLQAVFEAYNSFGGKKDMANMDGRTFAKFCKVSGMPPVAGKAMTLRCR